MKKDIYIQSLAECRKNEIAGIIYLAKNDKDLSKEDLQEVINESNEVLHEYNIAKVEQEQEDYMYGTPTDDELGLTQM